MPETPEGTDRSGLVLASASPRRHELLARLGVTFAIAPSNIAEEHPPGPAVEAVVAVALAKARAVAHVLLDPARQPAGLPRASLVVLGADTEVVLDQRLLGKPRDAPHAREMLRALRGRTHEVITGIALVEIAGEAPRPAPAMWREETASVLTRVTMAAYADEDIERYLATGEPFDKAGAYAVQGIGGDLVAALEGCYTNVVGLPLETTRRLLERAGVL